MQLELLLARAEADLGDIAASRTALAAAETSIDDMRLPADAPARLASALVRVQIDRHDGRQEHAREIAENLLAAYDHPSVNETLEFADLLRSLARQTYDDTKAAGLFERAFAITAARYGKASPVALADQRSVTVRDLQGAHRLDTNALLEQQARTIEQAFGNQSLDYADVLVIRCDMAGDSQRYAESLDCWRRILAIYETAPDADTLLAVAYDNIAANLLKLGKPAEALPFYERELAARLRNFAPTHQNVIHARLQIAKTRCLAGDPEQATQEWSEAMQDYVASVGPLHPWEAVYAAYFATCLLDADRVESARSIMQSHGTLDPPRRNMTPEDRADVQKVWDRLAKLR
jgi:tetratricopeptide (TPR) repeat protein